MTFTSESHPQFAWQGPGRSVPILLRHSSIPGDPNRVIPGGADDTSLLDTAKAAAQSRFRSATLLYWL